MKVSAKTRARLVAAAAGVAIAMSGEAGRADAEVGNGGALDSSSQALPAESAEAPSGPVPVEDASVGEEPTYPGVVGAASDGNPPTGDPEDLAATDIAESGPDNGDVPAYADAARPDLSSDVDRSSALELGDLQLPQVGQSEPGPLPVNLDDNIGSAPVQYAATAADDDSAILAMPASDIDMPVASAAAAGPLLGVLGFLGVSGAAGLPAAPAGPATATWATVLWWVGRVRHFLQTRFRNQSPVAGTPTMVYDPQTGRAQGDLNITDPDGDRLIYSVTTRPEHGDVSVNPDGTYTYTPGEDLRIDGGTDTFAVTASDHTYRHLHGIPGLISLILRPHKQHQHTVTQTVTVVVSPGNAAPVIDHIDYQHTVPASDADSVITVHASDRNDDPLTYAISGHLHGELVDGGNGVFLYTPDRDHRHLGDYTETLLITVDDGRGGSVTQAITFTVAQTNHAPVIHEPVYDQNLPNGTDTATITVTTTDLDGDPVTLTMTGAQHGTIADLGSGVFEYTPTWAYRHQQGYTEILTITADDGFGGVSVRHIVLTVEKANRAPVIDDVGYQGTVPAEDADTVIVVAASDADGDALTYTISGSQHGTITAGGNGVFVYTPDPDYRHLADYSETLLITVHDGHGGTASQSISFTVAQINRPPIIDQPVYEPSMPNGTDSTTITVTASDPDGDPVTITIAGNQHGTLIDMGDGVFVYAPVWAYRHERGFVETFTVTADDGLGGTTTRHIVLVIEQANEIPVIDDVDYPDTVPATDADTIITVVASDPDGDALTYTIAGNPHGSIVHQGSGVFVYTPDAEHRNLGDYIEVLMVTVDDGHGGTATTILTFTVEKTNQAPIIDDPVFDPVLHNGTDSTTITVSATDPNGDPVTLTVTGAQHGTLTDNGNGVFVYTPTWTYRHEQGYSETFTITAADGQGGVSTRQFTIAVEQANRVPVIHSTDFAPVLPANQDSTVITIVASDPDGDTLVEHSVMFGPYNGTVTVLGDGKFLYTPNSTDRSQGTYTESFYVGVDDGHGGSAWSEVSIVVQAPPAFDVVVDTTEVKRADDDASIQVTVTVPADGDVTLDFVTDRRGSVVPTGVSGEYRYIPSRADRTSATSPYVETVTITAVDEFGASTTQVLTFTVDPLTRVVGTYDVGDGPNGMAVGNGRLYVANANDHTVSVIDVETGNTIETLYVPKGPTELVLSGTTLYVISHTDKKITAIDTERIGNGDSQFNWWLWVKDTGDQPANIEMSPDGERVYVTALDGIRYRIYEYQARWGDEPTVPPGTLIRKIEAGNWALAISTDGKTAYSTELLFAALYVTDLETGTTTRVDLGSWGSLPADVVLNETGTYAYISMAGTDRILTYSIESGTIVGWRTITLLAGSKPIGMAIAREPDGNRRFLYVANSDANTISVYNESTRTLIATIPVGDTPQKIVVSADNRTVFVSNASGDSVTVIDARAI